jgi:drug/metabolite transporter, DME family
MFPWLTQSRFFRTAAFGTICGLLSAVGYTICNACLRAVSQQVDPFLVSAVRALPTILILAPVVAIRPFSGLPMLPPRRVLWLLLATGLLAHVAGNSLFQYSLGVVGMALAVPLCLGSMIVSGATLGRVVLGEPVTWRMAAALLLLIASIFALSSGAGAAQHAMESQSNTATLSAVSSNANLWLGVTAACAAGLMYAILGATIRHAAQGRSSVAQTLTIVSAAGFIGLAGISAWTVSPGEFLAINSWQALMMALAGLFNALAFIALTRALQLTSLVYVHALNATQATMAAVAGIALFGEAVSPFLLVGLGLTVGGLVLMQGSRPDVSPQGVSE